MREITVTELAALAARMATRGNGILREDKNLLNDCLLCGRIIATLVATGVIRGPVALGDPSPPIAPE